MKFKKEEHIFINQEIIQCFQTYWQKILILLNNNKKCLSATIYDNVNKQVADKIKKLFIELTDEVVALNINVEKKEIEEKINFFFRDISHLTNFEILELFLFIITLACIPSSEKTPDSNNNLCLILNKIRYYFYFESISNNEDFETISDDEDSYNGKDFNILIRQLAPNSYNSSKIIEKVDLNNWINSDEFFLNLMKYFYNKM